MPTNTVRQALFEELFFTALADFRGQQGPGARNYRFGFKNQFLSLDSTTIPLCLALFPWAHFRCAKSGVDAHVLLDHHDYLPVFVLLTESKRSDVTLVDSSKLPVFITPRYKSVPSWTAMKVFAIDNVN